MATAILLSENDKKLLQKLLDEFRTSRLDQLFNPSTVVSPSESGFSQQASDVYVVLPQTAGGIPGLTMGSPDVAGSAVCDVYRINESDELVLSTGGLTKRVYNLSTTDIPQDYTLAKKLKGGRWVAESLGSSEKVKWGMATENWTNSSPCPGVTVTPVDDCSGTNPTPGTSDDVVVLLPRRAEGDPNVVVNDVIAYTTTTDGTSVCVSDYLDAKIGSVMLWALAQGSIPPGWAVMDGTDNATPQGSGLDLSDKFIRAGSATGAEGGTETHFHEFVVQIPPHTISASQLAHTHPISINIDDHTVADLEHTHQIIEGTANLNEEITSPDFGFPEPCVGLPLDPEGLAGSSLQADCDILGSWGPLSHVVDASVLSGGPSAVTLVHTGGIGETSAEEHFPPYITMIFIERIDNSEP